LLAFKVGVYPERGDLRNNFTLGPLYLHFGWVWLTSGYPYNYSEPRYSATLVRVTLEKVSKRFGQNKVVNDLSLDVDDKEFLSLLGPSGCGKTTTLRCIAGLEHIDGGKIMMDDRVVNDVPPQQRNIAMVFQNYALYPFMNVRENITFPLRLHKVPKELAERKLKEVAELLHIGHLFTRKPRQLSGGEQQRVAIGRALVRDPELLLMDEPFSNLDAKLRIETRSEIKRLQKELGITTIFVTHDQAEAMALANRIAVMDSGVLMQVGSPNEVYTRPANVMVAQFMGSPPMNILEGELSGNKTVTIQAGGTVATVERPEVAGVASKFNGQSVRLGFRPEDATFERLAGDGIPAEVYVQEPSGTYLLLTLKLGDKLVKVFMPPDFEVEVGEKGTIRVKEGRLHIFDASSQGRLN
jgi:ABC-type sugar transport system ATPase subunit